MNIAEQLEKVTQEAIAERDKLKTERTAAHQAAQELKAVLNAIQAERKALEDGLVSLIEAGIKEQHERMVASIQSEQGRALRRTLTAVEEALRGLSA